MEPTLRGDPGHRDPALGAETRAGPEPVRPGDRAPDGRVDGPRLFDAFRGPHLGPAVAGHGRPGPPRAYGSCAARPTGRTYGTGLFLVRPDGYVGWAGDTPDGLGACLARFGRR
ncbi:hypothetical protein ACFT1B_32415 [Streptomyces griseoincarnatus]